VYGYDAAEVIAVVLWEDGSRCMIGHLLVVSSLHMKCSDMTTACISNRLVAQHRVSIFVLCRILS